MQKQPLNSLRFSHNIRGIIPAWHAAIMSPTYSTHPKPPTLPTQNEIAMLALKFYLDSNCQEGHDRENWLCAEYMLAQKHLIRCQLEAIQSRTLTLAA